MNLHHSRRTHHFRAGPQGRRASAPCPIRPVGQAVLLLVALALGSAPSRADDAVWLGGSGSWLEATQWSSGQVPNSFATNALLGGGANVSLHDAAVAIGSLSVGAGATLALTVPNALSISAISGLPEFPQPGTTLYSTGNIANAGTISLGSFSANALGQELWRASAFVLGVSTLSGGGSLSLASHTGLYGYQITNGPGHTITGSGLLGSASNHLGGLANQGNIVAHGMAIHVASNSAYSNQFANQGTVTVTSSLAITGATNNTGGQFILQDGASLVLNGTFAGGTVSGSGAAWLAGAGVQGALGVQREGSASPWWSGRQYNFDLTGTCAYYGLGYRCENTFATAGNFRDVTFAGVVNAPANGILSLDGTITNLATLNVNAANAAIRLNGHTILAGSGELVLGNGNSLYSGRSAEHTYHLGGKWHQDWLYEAVLTNGVDHTIRGSGVIGGATPEHTLKAGLINQGTIRAEGSDGLAFQLSGGQVTNTGTLVITEGSQIMLSQATLSGGVLAAQGVARIGGTSGRTQDGSGRALVGTDGVRDLTINGTLGIKEGTHLGAGGTLTINDRLVIDGSSGADTALRLDARTTLAGPGETRLVASQAEQMLIYSTFNPYSCSCWAGLVVGDGHTLRGGGTLAVSDLYNTGTILAEGAVPLTLRAGTGGNLIRNAGMIRSDGQLTVSGFIDNTGGVFSVTDGSALTISSPADGFSGGELRFAGSGVITANTLRDVALAGNVVLGSNLVSNSARTFSGGVLVQDHLTIGPFQTMLLGGDTMLQGPGTTVLAGGRITGGLLPYSNTPASHALTIEAGHTVSGNGALGGGTYGATALNPLSALVNRGTINANGPGGIQVSVAEGASVDNAGRINVQTSFTTLRSIQNTGIIDVRSGGRLSAHSLYNGVGSTLRVEAGASLSFADSLVLESSTLEAVGGTFSLPESTILNNATLLGQLQAAAGTTTFLSGIIDVHGGLSLGDDSGGSAATRFVLDRDTLLAGPGSTSLGRSGRNVIAGSEWVTFVDPPAGQPYYTQTGDFAGYGILDTSVPSNITYYDLTGQPLGQGAILPPQPQIVVSRSGLTIAAGHTLQGSGALGEATAQGQLNSLVNQGHINVGAGDALQVHLVDGVAFHNEGRVEVQAGGTLSGPGGYVQTSGELVNDGTITQSTIDIQGGVVSGTGVFNGTFVLGSGGLVNPGHSPGTLTINGDFYSTGTLVFEVGAGGVHDQIIVNGASAWVSGPVQIVFLSGFAPTSAFSFNFMSGPAALNWNPTDLSILGLNGYTYQYAFDASTGTASFTNVTAVPEPQTYLLMIAGLGLLGVTASRRGGRHGAAPLVV